MYGLLISKTATKHTRIDNLEHKAYMRLEEDGYAFRILQLRNFPIVTPAYGRNSLPATPYGRRAPYICSSNSSVIPPCAVDPYVAQIRRRLELVLFEEESSLFRCRRLWFGFEFKIKFESKRSTCSLNVFFEVSCKHGRYSNRTRVLTCNNVLLQLKTLKCTFFLLKLFR